MHVNFQGTVFRTYQHRIYPTPEQKNELDVNSAHTATLARTFSHSVTGY